MQCAGQLFSRHTRGSPGASDLVAFSIDGLIRWRQSCSTTKHMVCFHQNVFELNADAVYALLESKTDDNTKIRHRIGGIELGFARAADFLLARCFPGGIFVAPREVAAYIVPHTRDAPTHIDDHGPSASPLARVL